MKKLLLLIPLVISVQGCVVAPVPPRPPVLTVPVIRPVVPGVVVTPIIVEDDRREYRERGRGKKRGHRDRDDYDD